MDAESGGIAAPATENTLASEKAPRSRKKEGDLVEVHGDGVMDENVDTDILGREEKPKIGGEIGGERNIERGRDGIGGLADEQSDKKECVATENKGDPDKPQPAFDSPANENTANAEDCAAFGENTMLPSLASCNDKEKCSGQEHPEAKATEDAPLLPCLTNTEVLQTSPRECTQHVQGKDRDQAGGRVEELEEKESQTRGDEAAPKASKGMLSTPVIQEGHNASLLDKCSSDGDPELAPVSLPPCSQEERMKGREDHFRVEENVKEEKVDHKQAQASTGRSSIPPGSVASGDDNRGRVGEMDGQHGEETPGAETVEDACRAKLLKRKKRFMTTIPSTSSGDGPSTKAGDSPFARERPSETVPEMDGELASTRKQAASEEAAKMARRSERFRAKAAGLRLPSVSKTLCVGTDNVGNTDCCSVDTLSKKKYRPHFA